MSAAARSERVKPCLLDRIAGDEDGDQRAYRAFSPQRYKKAVLRDLRWLFNTGAHPAHMPLAESRRWSARKPGGSSSFGGDDTEGLPPAQLGNYPLAKPAAQSRRGNIHLALPISHRGLHQKRAGPIGRDGR